MKTVFKVIGIFVGTLIVFILIFGFVLVRTGFRSVEYVPYTLPKQTKTTWRKVFERPASVSVIPFKTAEMRFDRYPDNPPHSEDRYKATDVLAFAIRHARYGDMLIDTGFDVSFTRNPPFGNYPLFVKLFLKGIGNDRISQKKGHDIASLIKIHNINTKRVFFTHLHIDHTAGVPALPDNIEYVLDPRELNFMGKASLNYYLPNKRTIMTLDYSAAQAISPFNECLDLLGDGSLWAVSTPGHSPGHTSYVANAENGPVLITGDAAFYYWGFSHGIGSRVFDGDKATARKSREKLLAFSKQYSRMKVFVGHELDN